MTDETKPTTEEFLKMLEEAKSEWKRYNTMREAAPEMLEALKEAQANFKTYDRFKVDVDAMRKIEAAIDKAEGRSK